MSTRTRLKRHAALVDDMASARGIDLEAASLRAQLTPSDLADMVQVCAGCARPDACARWLSEQSGQATEGPGYCRNADVFARLASG